MSQKLVEHYTPKFHGIAYLTKILNDNDNNFYIAGNFDHLNGREEGSLIKLDANGKMVSGFQRLYTDQSIYGISQTPDGDLLIAGNFTKINGQLNESGLTKIDANGIVDASFKVNLEGVGIVGFQQNGKMIVSHYLAGWPQIARLNKDGSLDQNFTSPSSGYFVALAVDKADNIFVASSSNVIKLKPNGEPDPAFSVGSGVANGQISALEILPDGKIIVGGYFTSYNGVSSSGLIKLNPDGSVDTSFNIGTGVEGQVHDIEVRKNGNIVIGGQFVGFNGASASLVELKSSGALVKIIAVVSINNIQSIEETTDGKIAMVGEFGTVNYQSRPHAVLFNTDYTFDQNFRPDISYTNPNGRVLAVSSKNEIITGGGSTNGVFVREDSLLSQRLFKLDALGNPVQQSGLNNDQLVNVIFDENDRILVSGYNYGVGSTITRLLENGNIDPTFTTGSGPTYLGSQAATPYMERIGSTIFLGGYFNKFNETTTNGLVAIRHDGSLLRAFPNLPANSQAQGVAVQSDGKILACGYFPNANNYKSLVRILPDGSLDPIFQNLDIIGNIWSVVVDANDRIYLGGNLLTINGALTGMVARLTKDGQLDQSFDTATGWGGTYPTVTALAILPNNRLAVAGYFVTYRGNFSPGFVLLSADGNYIPTPGIKFGSSTVVSKMHYHNNGLFLGGRFPNEDRSKITGAAKITFLDIGAPKGPEDLLGIVQSEGIFKLSWSDKSDNEDGFVIERSFVADKEFFPIKTVDENVTTFEDNQINPNVKYYYRVKAINDGGVSNLSNTASVIWIPKPAQPSILTANQDALNKIVLLWQDNSNNEDGFVIERSDQNNTNYSKIDTVGANAITFTDMVSPKTTYFYRVTAFNAGGNSEPSNEVFITSMFIPAGPSSLQAKQKSETEVLLTWSDNDSNEDGFVLERSIDNGVAFTKAVTLEPNLTQYLDTVDPLHDSYTYRLKSFNKVGASDYVLIDLSVILGLEEGSSAGSIYPNPANDLLYFATPPDNTYLINSVGQKLFLTAEQSIGGYIAQVSQIPDGVYILVHESAAGRSRTRVRIRH